MRDLMAFLGKKSAE